MYEYIFIDRKRGWYFMKRFFCMLLALVLVLSLLPAAVFAEGEDWITVPGITGGRITFAASTGTITACETTVTAADIPSQIGGVTVKKIGNRAFKSCASLAALTLPDTLESIGANAFSGCTALESVILPEGLKEIWMSPFLSCPDLQYNLYGRSRYLGSASNPYFALMTDNDSVSSFSVHSDTKLIAGGICAGRTSLKHAVVPGNIRSVGALAFSESGLVDVTLKPGVEMIGSQAFDGCADLAKAVIPASVTEIGVYAFNGCSSLTDVFYGGSEAQWAALPKDGNDALASAEIHYNSDGTVPVTGISLNTETLSLKTGCTGTLKAEIVPGNATDKTVAWSSSAPAVAVVSDGEVEAIGEGTAVITASAGSVSASCTVTVTENTDTYYYMISLQDGGVIITGCDGLTSLNIPAKLEGLPVVGIDESAFSWNTAITDVRIPNCVKRIGSNAFYGCANLQSVSIGSGAEELGWSIFQDCTGLTDVTVSDGLETIGQSMFSGCTALRQISLPASVDLIEAEAFQGCTALSSLTLSENITEIGFNAFRNCTSLTSVSVPEGVEDLSGTFEGCLNLTEVYLGRNLTSVSGDTFSDTALNDVYFSGTQTLWDEHMLDNYSEELANAVKHFGTTDDVPLTGISLNRSILTLKEGASATLKVRYAPADTTETGVRWSSSDTNVATVRYDGKVTAGEAGTAVITAKSYYGNISASCTVTVTAAPPEWMTYDVYSQSVRCNDTSVTSVTVPATYMGLPVKMIEDYAFSGCASLRSVTIEDGVQEIGSSTFSGCSWLQSVTIPASVTRIGNSAFNNCYRLESVTLPEGLTEIQSGTFYNCNALRDVTIPSGVTAIGDNAFYKCGSINEFEIPESVKSIGRMAFYDCEGLTELELPSGLERIGADAFSYCGGLDYSSYGNCRYLGSASNPYFVLIGPDEDKENETSFQIHADTKLIGGGAFYDCPNLTGITIPDGVRSICASAFSNSGGLESTKFASVTIPSSVRLIDSDAFAYTRLTSVTIPEGVQELGTQVFYACAYLENVSLPSSLEKTGRLVFEGCEKLVYNEDVDGARYLGNAQNPYILLYGFKRALAVYPTSYTVQNGTKIIGNQSFYQCGQTLRTVTFPDSVVSVGENAFQQCYDLETVYVGTGLKTLDNYAFYDNNAITDVYYAGSKQQWSRIHYGAWNENLWSNPVIHFGAYGLEIKDIVPSSSSGSTQTVIKVEVDCDAEGAAVCCAVYDAEGRFKGFATVPVSEIGADGQCSFTFAGAGLSTCSIMLLNGAYAPIAGSSSGGIGEQAEP